MPWATLAHMPFVIAEVFWRDAGEGWRGEGCGSLAPWMSEGGGSRQSFCLWKGLLTGCGGELTVRRGALFVFAEVCKLAGFSRSGRTSR